ncbi:MAG: efflux RND transporter periplasmic adaptor subunit [Chthoniobacteraceae bacterium]
MLTKLRKALLKGAGRRVRPCLDRATAVRTEDNSAPNAKPAATRGVLREFRGSLLLWAATAALGLYFTAAVIISAYREPSTRTYPSKFGYPALLRKTGHPLPVTTVAAEMRTMTEFVMGEGMMASEPVLVPIIPMERIIAVHVEEGQRVKKGDLLIELDPAAVQIKIDSARISVATAKAELERVRIGSAYALAQERPQKNEINASAAASDMALHSEKIRMTEDLAKRGVISKKDLIDAKLTLTESERQLKMAQIELGMAEKGALQSEVIAQNVVAEAENKLRQRMKDLSDYQVRAPIDGVVERVLVHAGEFNPEPGKPSIVLAAGGWFEAHVDQAALNRVQIGDRAEVRLEALPGQVVGGHVKSIIPIVNYSVAGTPATRAATTSTPEWPSTFRIRVELNPLEKFAFAPGMTGYAKLALGRESIAVPEAAVTSLSAGSGVVHVVEAGGHAARQVRYGATSAGWTEVLDGLALGEQVIVEGHQFLESQDRIAPTPAHLANIQR